MTLRSVAKVFAAVCWITCFSGALTAAQSTPNVVANISSDGAIELEGVTYADEAALKVKVSEINKRRPLPAFHVNSQTGIRFEVLGGAIARLQRAGARLPVGFITDPSPKR